jgi:hypothetical protein
MALESTQPLTKMSTSNFRGGRLALKTDNLTAIYELILYKMWEHLRLTALWTSTACYKDNFTFIIIIIIIMFHVEI